MNFIIVGSGIGGLTAAIALARNGHQITVLERAPEPKTVGAGIGLQPNAMTCLATLDLVDAIKQRGCESTVAVFRHSGGRVIRELDFEDVEREFGFRPLTNSSCRPIRCAFPTRDRTRSRRSLWRRIRAGKIVRGAPSKYRPRLAQFSVMHSLEQTASTPK